ncbi:MAG TPA: hypothetical protein VF121_18250 [Thermoanaerobaculia bacterium]|nr:hypothetical protein [Thermoanaerobaculia bacterium]
MTDRQFNLIVRSNLQAAAEHVRRGHAGRWRHCAHPPCRDAQNLVPPLEALPVQGRAALLARALVAELHGAGGGALPN